MTTKNELDERYGRTSTPARRRAFWAIVAALGVAAVAGLAWVTVGNSVNSVGFDNTGHQIVDARTVTVSFQATPPQGSTFACALESLDEEFGVVGFRVVEYPAIEGTSRPFTETIATVALATTAVVQSCWVT